MKYELQDENGEPVYGDVLPDYLTNPEPRLAVWGRRTFLRAAMYDRDEPCPPLVYRETSAYWIPPAH